MEQQEHLKSMMAATMADALTTHSLKDQYSQEEDVNKTSKLNDANEHKGHARFELWITWRGSRLPQDMVCP